MGSGSASAAALFLLLAAASCAPSRRTRHDVCGDVRGSSLELNHVARTVAKEARNGSKDVSSFTTALLWLKAEDKCDPESLKHKPETCLEKIFNVLTTYISAVERVAGIPSCSAFVRKVEPKMQKLHKDMKTCFHLDSHTGGQETDRIENWEEEPLCHYTLDRLFSFSILSARVFAAGDPAHHAKASAQKCM